jgi:hypothetical protein
MPASLAAGASVLSGNEHEHGKSKYEEREFEAGMPLQPMCHMHRQCAMGPHIYGKVCGSFLLQPEASPQFLADRRHVSRALGIA